MLPKIGIWSIFRDDGNGGVEAYRQCIESLVYPRNKLRLYLTEGDSVDDTFRQLVDWVKVDRRVSVIKADSGLPRHGHTTDPERFRILAQANNASLDMLAADNWADYALVIESDLLIQPDLIRNLLLDIPDSKSIIAPMIWLGTADGSYRFYDTWAFRFLDGSFFPMVDVSWYKQNVPASLFEVSGVGSIILFPMSVVKAGCRLDSQVLPGMCAQARAMGYRVYANPQVNVFHPPEE